MSASQRMRTLSFVILTAFGVGLVASAAHAETHRLHDKHEEWEVLGTCAKVKGVPISITGLYGCIKPNCDGKGGECRVECTDSSPLHRDHARDCQRKAWSEGESNHPRYADGRSEVQDRQINPTSDGEAGLTGAARYA